MAFAVFALRSAVLVALLWTATVSGDCKCSTLLGDDPEEHYDAIQLICCKGYPAESHYVPTSDGYILGMQRIPHGKNMSPNVSRPVVFLQHGVLGASTNWLTNLANESFAYLLADAGFDVWMGNVRGNTYSRNHTTLSPNDRKFWDFTFDQHSLIDLPAMLDYTLRVSKQEQLFYVGHSQGTVMGFAGFTANKTLGEKVKAFFALAPVTTVKHIEGALSLIAPNYKWLEWLLDIVGHGEFLPNSDLVDWLADKVCPFNKDLEYLCKDVLFLICGFDQNNINTTRIPVYYSHSPAGTSVKNIAHFAQEVESGKFEMYDYGSADANANHYHGLKHPPAYNVSKLTVPTALFTGSRDWLADPQDVAGLIPKIKHTTFYQKNIDYYEHLDFIWGLDAAPQVYDVIISQISSML